MRADILKTQGDAQQRNQLFRPVRKEGGTRAGEGGSARLPRARGVDRWADHDFFEFGGANAMEAIPNPSMIAQVLKERVCKHQEEMVNKASQAVKMEAGNPAAD